MELLEAASYPMRDVNRHAFGQAATEIEATLYATAVDADELDRVMAQLERHPGVLQTFWNARTERQAHGSKARTPRNRLRRAAGVAP